MLWDLTEGFGNDSVLSRRKRKRKRKRIIREVEIYDIMRNNVDNKMKQLVYSPAFYSFIVVHHFQCFFLCFKGIYV